MYSSLIILKSLISNTLYYLTFPNKFSMKLYTYNLLPGSHCREPNAQRLDPLLSKAVARDGARNFFYVRLILPGQRYRGYVLPRQTVFSRERVAGDSQDRETTPSVIISRHCAPLRCGNFADRATYLPAFHRNGCSPLIRARFAP